MAERGLWQAEVMGPAREAWLSVLASDLPAEAETVTALQPATITP